MKTNWGFLMKRKRALLLALLLFAGPALADTATVLAIRGDVYSDDVLVLQGEPIAVGSVIKTGPKSFVVLQFEDGAKVTVRPSTEMEIVAYDYMGTNEAELSLISGGLRIVTGSLAKTNPENYKVRTPVALMGVRGTEFSVQVVE
jgi:hypothetical protein